MGLRTFAPLRAAGGRPGVCPCGNRAGAARALLCAHLSALLCVCKLRCAPAALAHSSWGRGRGPARGGDGLAGHTRRPAAPRRGTAAQPVMWPPGRTTLSATERKTHITAGSRMGVRRWQLRSVWGSHVATAPRARSFGVATLRSIAVASSCRLLNPLLSPRIRAYCPSRRRHGTPGMAMVRSAFPGPLGPQSLVPCGALSLMCAVPCARGPQRVGGQGGSPAACRAAARCAGAFVMAGGGG